MGINKITSTKANLMKANDMLALMVTSYDLLDKKRVVLLKQLEEEEEKVRTIGSRFDQASKEFSHLMEVAMVTLGRYKMEQIIDSVPIDHSLRIRSHSYMGLEIQDFTHDKDQAFPDFDAVHLSLDFVAESLFIFKDLLIQMAAHQSAVDALRREADKTEKRANALEKIQIPKYEAIKKQIDADLEEKEREEFFRLKLVKKKKE